MSGVLGWDRDGRYGIIHVVWYIIECGGTHHLRSALRRCCNRSLMCLLDQWLDDDWDAKHCDCEVSSPAVAPPRRGEAERVIAHLRDFPWADSRVDPARVCVELVEFRSYPLRIPRSCRPHTPCAGWDAVRWDGIERDGMAMGMRLGLKWG